MKDLLTIWEDQGFEDRLKAWERIAMWRDRLWMNMNDWTEQDKEPMVESVDPEWTDNFDCIHTAFDFYWRGRDVRRQMLHNLELSGE